MSDRVKAINPNCQLNPIDDHLTLENIPKLVDVHFDFIIDCIDHFRIKAALIHYCKRNKIKIITIGGAGGRIDPTKICIADLTRAHGDALLARTRKQLRQRHDFSKNIKRRFDIPCVYSTEPQRYPTDNEEISTAKSDCRATSGLNCANGFGSLTAVTASFGMVAAAYVLKKIAACC